MLFSIPWSYETENCHHLPSDFVGDSLSLWLRPPSYSLKSSLAAGNPPGSINQVASTFARFHFQPKLCRPSLQSVSCHCFLVSCPLCSQSSGLPSTQALGFSAPALALASDDSGARPVTTRSWSHLSGTLTFTQPLFSVLGPFPQRLLAVFISFLRLPASPSPPSLSAKDCFLLFRENVISWVLPLCQALCQVLDLHHLS